MIKNKKILIVLTASILAGCSSSSSSSGSSGTQSTSAQAQAIYNSMTLEQKIGQLIQPSFGILMSGPNANSVRCDADLHQPSSPLIDAQTIVDCGLDQIGQYHLGAVLQGGGPLFTDLAPTATNWRRLNLLAKAVSVESNSYDPLLLIGNDAIHVNMHVQGGVMGPHNVGMGAANDPALMQQLQKLAAQDSLATGFNWVFAPTIAEVHDERWGRSYEGFSANSAVLQSLTTAAVNGLQNVQNGKITGVLATAKHFIGDGATQFGLDEGDDAYTGTESDFWAANGKGYEAAVDANVGSIMASYSAIDGNDTRMHFGGKWDIINQFKETGIIGTGGKNFIFPGFIISDYNGAVRAAYFYDKVSNTAPLTLPQIFAKSINGGVDMQMVAGGALINVFDPSPTAPVYYSNVGQVFDAIKTAYNDGLISENTLHNSVMRILIAKLSMAPQSVPLSQYASIQAQERTLALQAAKESLILLKNQNSVIPVVAGGVQNVVFVGDTNDVGIQNGGWTINWQGQEGNRFFTGADQLSSGTVTIESAVMAQLGSSVNYYHVNSTESLPSGFVGGATTLVIGVVNEPPYAEYMGDIANSVESDQWYAFGIATNTSPYFGLSQSMFQGVTYSISESAAVGTLQANGSKVITVIYSGRPVILSGAAGSPDSISNAEIAAFLPGTTGGQAISDAIFGNYRFGANGFSNTLPFPWPTDMTDVELHFPTGGLYPVGYGLTD